MMKALSLLLLLIAGEVHAQRVVALTAALSVTQEAGRLYGESLDFGTGTALPGPVILPGEAVREMLLSQGQVLVATEGAGGAVEAQRLAMAPFGLAGNPVARDAAWAEWPVLEVMDGLVSVATDGANWRTLLRRGDGLELASLDLPWRPVSWTATTSHTVTYLCASEEGPKLLQWRMSAAGRGGEQANVLSRRLDTADSAGALAPGAVARSWSSPHVLVVLSDHMLNKSSVQLYEPTTLEPLGEPLDLSGIVSPTGGTLATGALGNFWVATHLPGTDFGYITQVQITGERIGKVAEYALSSGVEPPRLAVVPESGQVAVGVGKRVEVWPNGARGDAGVNFTDQVSALDWSPEGLVAAEGSRVHLLDPATCVIRSTIQLQSGHVRAVAVLPAAWLPAPDADADGVTDAEEVARGTLSGIVDSDGDGIADGVDPEGRLVSPRLKLPARVTLRADAMGQEVRGIPVGMAGFTTPWRVTVPESAPWLVAWPLRGIGPGVVYAGIDPGRFRTAQDLPPTGLRQEAKRNVSVSVEMRGALGSPGVVDVEVLPSRRIMREILWVWPGGTDGSLREADDPRGVASLANLLAGSPHFFAHREAWGPVREDLGRYTLLVVDVRAAERGAVARQDVLEYLQAGGGVLFLTGEPSGGDVARLVAGESASAESTAWLSPLGVRILGKPVLEGRYEALGNHLLARAWRQFPVKSASRVLAESADLVVATGEGHAILAAKAFGYGRAVVLAAPTPLQNAALEEAEAQVFARVLVEWLAAAGQEVEDMDGDGLVDALEDVNDTGTADPGETDYLRPDTDGDGVPDAMEDRNRNGRVDEGETDPRNADSDADGICDGADSMPVPAFGAPQIALVTPAETPAEGGTLVVVQGKNFAPDSRVWFGTRQAPAVRVISPDQAEAEVPQAETEAGGLVEVRVESPAQGTEARLPRGFRYGPRTQLRVGLESTVWRGAAQTTGLLRVRLDAGGGRVPVGTLRLTLEASPRVMWGVAQPWSNTQRREQSLSARPAGAGLLRLEIQPVSGGMLEAGRILRVPWQAEVEAGEVSFRLVQGTLTTETGVVLQVVEIALP